MDKRGGGELIREARRRARLTQAELARRLNTRQSVIARWESGQRSPTYETLERAAEACGLQLDVELRWKEELAASRQAVARMLRLSPQERLELIGAEGRNLLELDASVRR